MRGISPCPSRSDTVVIGLTGGIGSGKSTVAELFVARGAVLVDTDQIAHALTAPHGVAIAAIHASLGAAFITSDGALDRKVTRRQVFADPTIKHQLESILHPLIQHEVDRALAAASRLQSPYVMLAVPLLFESLSYRRRTTRTLLIDCPTTCQIQRVGQRSGLAEDETRRIMAAQLPREIRLQLADDLIWNGDSPQHLTPQVETLNATYLKLAQC